MLDNKKAFIGLSSPEVALDVLMMAYTLKHGPQLIDELSKELVAYIAQLTNEDYSKEFENAMDAISCQRVQLLEYVSDKELLLEFVKNGEYAREQKKQ